MMPGPADVDRYFRELLALFSPTREVASSMQQCSVRGVKPESKLLKSIHVDLGWTFTTGAPSGKYTLSLAGQVFTGVLAGGGIRVDNELSSLYGNGSLKVELDDGPTYSAEVSLDLPPVQTLKGMVRRLTNLGWYAGHGADYDRRAAWAVRAFKRARMNEYVRGATVREDDGTDADFLKRLQEVYGAHSEDQAQAGQSFLPADTAFQDCGLFGARTLLRSSFGIADAPDDRDPGCSGGSGVWGGAATAGVAMPIAGPYRIFLRAFDSGAGEPVMPNRVNLPQPVLMAKFVLWELGYWLVADPPVWTAIDGTETRFGSAPAGTFDRAMQWAVREFQCYAKAPTAAREQASHASRRYLPRLVALSPHAFTGPSRYAEQARVSGALNEATRRALQAWAEQSLRCPVVVYSSSDTSNPAAAGSNFLRIRRENLWLHDDHEDQSPRMYALDWSGLYQVPDVHGGTVVVPDGSIPRPIVVGEFSAAISGGPVSLPPRHTWQSDHTEVTPGNLLGTGGSNGAGLTQAQLSTFKVVRTAAHFECMGFFDVLNAYDDVCISFGPCHWTLARTAGGTVPNEAREMPAFLAYFNSTQGAAYTACFGRFGLQPEEAWPLTMSAVTGTYATRISIQTETGTCNLAGLTGSAAERMENNCYCKTWHSYWRFLMACRTSAPLRLAMWGFSRQRIADILDKSFVINGHPVRVGDIATSEKAAAMLLRWHIYRPAHLFRTHTPASPNHLRNVLSTVVAAFPTAGQQRENGLIAELDAVGSPHTNSHLQAIRNMNNVPQTGAATYYHLNLTSPGLSSELGSLDFLPP